MFTDLHTKLDKLVLGSAQFGLDYGISNAAGKVPFEEVKQILSKARETGINTIDTAAAYGDSEAVLGKALKELQFPASIITKYPAVNNKNTKDAFCESLERLQIEKVHGYLLHNFSIYQKNPDILKELQELKSEGKVDKIGVSIYHPHEAAELLEKQEQIDILQFPYNVFDRRFEPLFPSITQQKVESHIRSVFLQGLFFLNPSHLPAKLQRVAPKIRELNRLSQEHNLPLEALLLGFVLSSPHISKVIMGVESLKNLTDNITYFNTTLPQEIILKLQDLKEVDETILLPYNWS